VAGGEAAGAEAALGAADPALWATAAAAAKLETANQAKTVCDCILNSCKRDFIVGRFIAAPASAPARITGHFHNI
jgi:hypothetical protein